MAIVGEIPSATELAARITGRRRLYRETFELALRLPSGFAFRPGQHIRIHQGHQARDYSLIPSRDPQQALILVRRIPQGAVSTQLCHAAPGTPLAISGPRGRFLFQPSPRLPVFVATGTGIAPFVAMHRAGETSFTLLHGVRHAEELYYGAELQRGAARYVPCLSGEPSGTAGAFAGRVTVYLADRLAPGCYDFYLAGRREMIAEAVSIIDARFATSRVYTEIFY